MSSMAYRSNGWMPLCRSTDINSFGSRLYTFMAGTLIWNLGRKGLWVLLLAFATAGVSDTMSSKVIKNTVKRVRPCNEHSMSARVIERIRCGGGYSFTSSHATNHSAIAFFFFFLFAAHKGRWRWALVLWAISIGMAQIFVGVHYPLDVICGLLLGLIIGRGMAALTHRVVFARSQWPDPSSA